MGIYAIMQFPLHLYFVVALRASNANRLHNGNENEWNFGQIVPLVTLLPTIVECLLGVAGSHSSYLLAAVPSKTQDLDANVFVTEYHNWRKGFRSMPDDEEDGSHTHGTPIEMMPTADDTHRHQY